MGYLRDRAIEYGAECVNGLVTRIDVPANHKTSESKYTLHYQEFEEGKSSGTSKSMEVDLIVGADGANSRVAKAMDAGEYNFAIAFQERIKIPDDKMKFYEEMAEMYVGDDVSPDFYRWNKPTSKSTTRHTDQRTPYWTYFKKFFIRTTVHGKHSLNCAIPNTFNK